MFIKSYKPFGKVNDVVIDITQDNGEYPRGFGSCGSRIAESLRMILVLLKVFGNSPISSRSISSKNKPAGVTYEINWSSRTTLTSGLIGFLSVFIWVLFLINIGFETPFLIDWFIKYKDIESLLLDETNEAAIHGMIKTTYIIAAVVVILEVISRWAHAGRLLVFLNAWNGIEIMMKQNFPPHEYDLNFCHLTKYRDKLLLFYVVYPSMIVVPTFISVYCSRLHILARCLATIIVFQFITLSLLEDVKMCMNYRALSSAFAQVRRCVEERNKKIGKPVTVVESQSWRTLILKIRTQTHRASDCHKFEELVRTVAGIALLTISIYLILNSWQDAEKRHDMLFLMSMVGLSCLLIGRTLAKAYMAEQITNEEAKLARTLTAMSSTGLNARSLLELKCITDTIGMDPVRINFSNFVVLNKQLLLKMFSQVVTYLIVLMQLNESNTNTD